MKNSSIITLIFLFTATALLGCQSQSSENHRSPAAEKTYTEIRDGLNRDTQGNLYFKTRDLSKPTGPEDRFIYVVYSSTFGDTGIKIMTEVVDSMSFKSMNGLYFTDRNHVYYFTIMHDGGTMRIVDEADSHTFKAFENSLFGVDAKSAFYRGTRMDGVDIASFEPIRVIVDGRNVTWYAKDKNSYYDGQDIMSDEEIAELEELLTGSDSN